MTAAMAVVAVVIATWHQGAMGAFLSNVRNSMRPVSRCMTASIPTNTSLMENHSVNVRCWKISAVPVPMAMKAAGDRRMT